MTGNNQGFAEAVVRFRAELSAAVTRSRRAAAEARDQSATFRDQTSALADEARDGKAEADPTDETHRATAADWRRAQGLPVAEFAAVTPAPAQVPDDDDEDFSERSIMFRG
ncbi:hypothetical protein [Alloactinosynnema sp. L-07]|uniref:hypothetical protein n=1 Tax=Alloactinosynnema sp. L-07 TaxID=1653480 RepID=UPI00065F0109|nr:hypothetical protein [Alloactinosynnema sp. L-07]CRK59979.1 hypothetical protein [Alloactinosynnema sp. L-07]